MPLSGKGKGGTACGRAAIALVQHVRSLQEVLTGKSSRRLECHSWLVPCFQKGSSCGNWQVRESRPSEETAASLLCGGGSMAARSCKINLGVFEGSAVGSRG